MSLQRNKEDPKLSGSDTEGRNDDRFFAGGDKPGPTKRVDEAPVGAGFKSASRGNF